MRRWSAPAGAGSRRRAGGRPAHRTSPPPITSACRCTADRRRCAPRRRDDPKNSRRWPSSPPRPTGGASPAWPARRPRQPGDGRSLATSSRIPFWTSIPADLPLPSRPRWRSPAGAPRRGCRNGHFHLGLSVSRKPAMGAPECVWPPQASDVAASSCAPPGEASVSPELSSPLASRGHLRLTTMTGSGVTHLVDFAAWETHGQYKPRRRVFHMTDVRGAVVSEDEGAPGDP